MRTAAERAVVDLLTWSAALALWSPRATIVGVGVGLWAIWRAGWSARLSKVVAATVVSAVLLTVGGATLLYLQLHRRPNPAAEQPVALLPAPIRALHESCFAGDAPACGRIAAKYDRGEDVPRSGTVAVRYYSRGCDLGDCNSCMDGGTLLIYGGADPSPDPARGLQMLKRSCEQEYPLGCLKTGIVYRLGHGIQSDPAIAREYFDRACKLGAKEGCDWAREITAP